MSATPEMTDPVAEMKARAREFLCNECSVIIDEWDFPQRTWHQITDDAMAAFAAKEVERATARVESDAQLLAKRKSSEGENRLPT